jgi:hypothetical protein
MFRALSWVHLVGFLFVSSLARAVYSSNGAEPSQRFEVLCAIGSLTFVWFWLEHQCRPHGASFPIDMPLFAASLWIVFLPYYMWRYERWRGLLKLSVLLGAYLASYACSVAFHYLLVWTAVEE